MRSSSHAPRLLGLVVALSLGLPAVSAGAHGRSGRQDGPASARHSWEHASHPTPPWGWGWMWTWSWGRGHDGPYAEAWRQRWCELLPDGPGHGHGWGYGPALFALLGCAQPGDSPPAPDPLAPPPEHTLLADDGSALADLGSLDLDAGVVRVPLVSSFSGPVVIVGPPTDHEADPGVPQVMSVDDAGFRIRFREWDYLDQAHAAEAVSYLAVAPGRHQMSDGSEWEAGVLDLSDTDAWGDVVFSAPFVEPPLVFLTVQTANEDTPTVVRARGVTAQGFQAALFEEEGADGAHGTERVGYLAVSSPAGSGRVDVATGSLPYLGRSVVVDDRRVPVLSASLWMEEEGSLDDELTHADENVAFLALGPNVFAQDLSSGDLDTAAVRRAAPEYGPVMEWGTLTGVDDAWHTVPLARDYTDPVVVVGPMSLNDGDPAVLRVRNVSTDAFQVRSQSWAYLNRPHGPERTFYMVVDPGIQSLAGLVVEAGHLDTSLVLNDAQESVVLPMAYADVPGVFASVMTENGTQPVTVRVAHRTSDGFRIALQPEEAYGGGLPSERLGWVSIQLGRGVTTDGRVVSVFDALVDQYLAPVSFGETLRGRFPTLLGTISSALGFDPVVLRYSGLTPDAVSLELNEEQSANPEMNHVAEEVSILVAE